MTREKRRKFRPYLFAVAALAFFLTLLPLPTTAAPGVNAQLNYQGRLYNGTGQTVPDGTYNMRFKIYQDGNGCVSSGSSPCGGSLEWTETRESTNRVTVRNGYFSVQLGSVTAFGSSVDWNQDTLWLSIDVGGTGTPSYDGEMTPFRRLTAVPQALNSQQLGGLDWSKFVQVAPSAAQIDSSTLSSLFLNKTGASGNILQLQKNGVDVVSVANDGRLTIAGDGVTGSQTLLEINNLFGAPVTVDQSGNLTVGETLTAQFVDATDGLYVGSGQLCVDEFMSTNVGFGTCSANAALHVDRGNATASAIKFTAGTTTGATATDGFDVGVTSAGVALINQRENLALTFNTNNTQRLSISGSGDVTIGATDATGNVLVLDVKTGTGDPAGTVGAMYYNSGDGKFRCYQASAWTDCISAGGSVTLQQAYDASGTPATITTSSSSKGILFKSGSGFNSTTAFQIQPDGSTTPVFNVDTTNGRIGIGTNAPTAAIQVDKGTATASAIKFTAGGTTEGGGADWCNDTTGVQCTTDWGARREITFDNVSSSENLTDFPVLVKLNSSRIDYGKTQNAGQDIRFVDPSDPTVALSHEIESWNESGDSFVWVKVPQLDAGSSTDSIWMYYGNPTVGSPATQLGNSTHESGTWDGNFAATYHMREDPSVTNCVTNKEVCDSTANANNADSNGSMTTGDQVSGQVNGSLDFDGTNDNIRAPDSNSLDITGTVTLSAWVRASALTPGNWYTIISKENTVGNIANYALQLNNSGYLDFFFGAGGTYRESLSNTALVAGNWYHVAATYSDAANEVKLYIDGNLDATRTENNSIAANTHLLTIGSFNGSFEFWPGIIDEVRISNSVRSADWVKAEYLTMSDTMNTYGSEEAQDGSTDGFDLGITATGAALINQRENQALTFNTNNTQRLSIAANGNVVVGAGDGATQTAIKVRGSNATGNDMAGVDFTFDASNGTGSGGSGDFVFRTAAANVGGGGAWCNDTTGVQCTTDWGARREITFDNVSSSENLTDFPVLVKLNSSRIDYGKTQNAGQDIRFVDPSDPTVALAHEIEEWNESGDSYVWVKVPQIDQGSDTDFIYMYYDNAGAGDGQDVSNVWDGSHRAVWHFKESGNGTLNEYVDSTSFNHHARGGNGDSTRTPDRVTAQVGFGQDFNNSDDHITSASTSVFDGSQAHTIELWMNADNCGEGGYGTILRKGVNPDLYLCDPASRNFFYRFDGTATDAESAGDVYSFSTWHHVAIRYSSGAVDFFVDGAQVAAPDATATGANTSAITIIGGDNTPSSSYNFDGRMDEFRISSTNRSTSWINANYKTQSDTMNTYGSEEGQVSADPTDPNTMEERLRITAEGDIVMPGLVSCPSVVTDAGGTLACGASNNSVTVVRKSADETRTSSAALANDSELAFNIGANENWAFEFNVIGSSGATPDFQFAVTAPSGATCRYGILDDGTNTVVTTCGGTTGLVVGDGDNETYSVRGTIENGGTAGTVRLQWAQNTSNASNTIVREGSSLTAFRTQGADLAEVYYAREQLAPGTVVALDGSLQNGVQRSQRAYDRQVLGVISTQPGLVLGDGKNSGGGVPVYVGLSGRVPVKVSTENGTIREGDILTASSTPGVAMKATKAGMVIGVAMEDFSGSGTGSVMSFIKNMSYGGGSFADLAAVPADTNTGDDTDSNTAAMTQSQRILSTLLQQREAFDVTTGSELITDRLAAGVEIVTPTLTASNVNVDEIGSASGGGIGMRLSGGEKFSIKNAQNEMIIDFDTNGNAVFAGNVQAQGIDASKITGLEALIKSLLYPTEGSAAGDSQLTLANLQQGFFSGGIVTKDVAFKANVIFEDIARFNDSVTINGGAKFDGAIEFGGNTAGTTRIPAGDASIIVRFSQPHQTTPSIAATPQVFIDGGYRIKDVSTTEFTIELAKEQSQEIVFGWTALLTEQPSF